MDEINCDLYRRYLSGSAFNWRFIAVIIIVNMLRGIGKVTILYESLHNFSKKKLINIFWGKGLYDECIIIVILFQH